MRLLKFIYVRTKLQRHLKKYIILERNECDQFATLKQTNHNLIPLPYNDRKPSITRLLSGTHTASNIHQATSFVVRRVHN